LTDFHDPSATGLTMGTPDAAKPHLFAQVRSLVPVEKDRFDMSANATSKVTVTHGGQGINRSNREVCQ